jgi:hypothetical protein
MKNMQSMSNKPNISGAVNFGVIETKTKGVKETSRDFALWEKRKKGKSKGILPRGKIE